MVCSGLIFFSIENVIEAAYFFHSDDILGLFPSLFRFHLYIYTSFSSLLSLLKYFSSYFIFFLFSLFFIYFLLFRYICRNRLARLVNELPLVNGSIIAVFTIAGFCVKNMVLLKKISCLLVERYNETVFSIANGCTQT